MVHIGTAHIVMAYTDMACIVMAYTITACVVMAETVMDCIVMAYVVMACIVMACIVMADIVMARTRVSKTWYIQGLSTRVMWRWCVLGHVWGACVGDTCELWMHTAHAQHMQHTCCNIHAAHMQHFHVADRHMCFF